MRKKTKRGFMSSECDICGVHCFDCVCSKCETRIRAVSPELIRLQREYNLAISNGLEKMEAEQCKAALHLKNCI